MIARERDSARYVQTQSDGQQHITPADCSPGCHTPRGPIPARKRRDGCTLDRGWHRTAAIGVFGAAAAAGKLIGLTPEEMRAAFGIAYSHAAGNRQCILDGALTKRMQAGQAASAGGFLRRFGADRVHRRAEPIFNGRFGFLELYQPNGYDASVLLRDLGAAFRGEALSYKPYPCGRRLHAAIGAALAARAQLKLERPDDIASVTNATSHEPVLLPLTLA